MRCPIHRCIGPSCQWGCCSGCKLCICLKLHKIICYKVFRLVNGLYIHFSFPKIRNHIKLFWSICIYLNGSFQIIPTCPTVQRSCQTICSFRPASIQTVSIQHTCPQKQIIQPTHLIMVKIISKNFQAVLPELLIRDFKNLPFFSPVKFQRHCRNSSFR